MARPIKKGLDYFPLNVNLSGSVEYIRCMYGKLGEAVIISLWQRIFENSYYIEYNDLSALVFSKEFGIQLEMCFADKKKKCWEIFDEIVKQAVKFGVFDKDIFEKHSVLTSKSIQEIYVEAKRKKAADVIDKEYCLINLSETTVNDAKGQVNTPITSFNSTIIPQSKENNNKENNNKKNKSINNYRDTNEINYEAIEKYLFDRLD